MTVQAAAFRSRPGGSASRQASIAVAVEIDANKLNFTEQPNKTFADGVELSLFALDERGRAHGGTFYQVNLALRPETYERVRGSIVRMNPRITLPPGRYQLRVGVRESGAGEMGSVFYDLIVPDFSNDLAMSGMLLTDQASRGQLTAQPDTEVRSEFLPTPVISRRTFSQNDVLTLFTELYDNASNRTPRSIEIVTTLAGDNGTAVFSSRENIDGGLATGGPTRNTIIPYGKQIPLKDVRPGNYVLKVDAHSRDGGKPVSRETAIRVVD
jgi:hypothetical protein